MLEAAQLERMSVEEKVQAMEQLWEALGRDREELPSPAWHAEVLAERKRRALSGESRFLTLEQLKVRLRHQ